MTVEQVVINDKAIRAQAERLTATGWDGDAYRFVESLLLNAVADGYARIEPVPAPRGPGASRAAIDEAQKATERAVRAAKDSRKPGRRMTSPISPPAGRCAHAGTHLPNGDSQ